MHLLNARSLNKAGCFMDEGKKELVRNWLLKAQHDNASAKKLSEGDNPYLDTAIYHCQQAAEKAIKGFLVFHDQRFEKTHDLQVLINLATSADPSVSALLDNGELLTPYATLYRYPGEILEPEIEEFNEAIKASESIYTSIINKLPEEVHP